MSEHRISTVGERVDFASERGWVAEVIQDSLLGQPDHPLERATVAIRVEGSGDAFHVRGWEVLARGVWRRRGHVVIENVCSSGFDLLVRPLDDCTEFIYRWRPDLRARAESAIRSRFHLLLRAALLQYPAMWRAGTRHRVPVHASIFAADAATPLVGGAGGVGKSTLLQRELAAGALAVSDNLCVTDGLTTWGLVEPLRMEAAAGRRMPHGRRELPFVNRRVALIPDRIVLLRREGTTFVRPCPPARAARALAAGTYMAGELRRYWSFAATLAEGTGLGPAHPPVAGACDSLARRLPRVEVSIARDGDIRLSDLLADHALARAGHN
jgi:hypothetical protein